MHVHKTKGSGHFFLDLERLADDGLRKHPLFLSGWRADDTASLGDQMYVGKHLSQSNRQDIDKASQLPLQSALDDAQQILVITLRSEKLKDLQHSLHQLLGQPHLLLIFGAVIGVSGDDCNEVVLGLVLCLAAGEAGEVLELLDALLHPPRVEFDDLVEVGDRQHTLYHQFLFKQTNRQINILGRGRKRRNNVGIGLFIF